MQKINRSARSGKNIIGWSGLALLIIIIAAIFVRVYKFEDYLYFKMDQSRDALLLTKAVENGPQYLPLLGARVGAVKLSHGMLRLGPISYYFQYASAKIFQSTDAYVYAYPDLLFSILAVPLLYFLVRLYFSKKNSLLIVLMYSLSFIIIQYSRFAWNPNSLQFFLLLSFYGLLRFLNEPEVRRKKKWLIIWALGMTIGSQLHFFGFFSLLGISGLLIIFHYGLWKKSNVLEQLKIESLKVFGKWAAIVFVVFAIFYTPVFISDVYEHGQNTKNFFEAMSAKPVNKPLNLKIAKSASENLKYYCLITTSQCYGSSMKKEYPAIALTALILLAGFILVIRKLKKRELTSTQKDFLTLLLIWVGVFTILTIPVSFQLRPRFFIVVFAIPFISLGLIFEYLDEKLKNNLAIPLSVALASAIVLWNSHGTLAWFKEQAKSQKSNFIVKRTLILKAKDGVTLGQLQAATDWIYSRHIDGTNLYYYVKPEHQRPFDFLLRQKHDKKLNIAIAKLNGDPHAQYFAILPAKTPTDQIKTKFKQDFNILASQQFGQISVYEVEFPGRIIEEEFKFSNKKAADDRIFWKDVFSDQDKSSKNK